MFRVASSKAPEHMAKAVEIDPSRLALNGEEFEQYRCASSNPTLLHFLSVWDNDEEEDQEEDVSLSCSCGESVLSFDTLLRISSEGKAATQLRQLQLRLDEEVRRRTAAELEVDSLKKQLAAALALAGSRCSP